MHVFHNRNWCSPKSDRFFFLTLSEDSSIGSILSDKKYGGTGLLSEKTEALHTELNEGAEAATRSYYNIFIRSLWLRIIWRSDQGVQFMNFPAQIFFNDSNHGYRAAILKKSSLRLLPFYMAVAIYCYYEKVRRKMRTSMVSYLLNRNSR